MNNIDINIQTINKKIKEFLKKKNNPLKKITIIAVSKNQNIDKIKLAISSGINEFGENYVQEGINKIQKLKKHNNLIWHFIGKVQSNKTKLIAKNFDWCQTIDREKIAILLNKYRKKNLFPMNVLMQINISNETNKNGVCIKNYKKLAKIISLMPNLNFRGIMIMPSTKKEIIKKYDNYKKGSIIFHELKKKYQSIDTLSLGTSFDIEQSLLFQSNMIRIGRSIFKNKMI
ncbi:YggS family pyridoxal phosphate-dependent enzyme [Buchnera aphidicola]|uniref:Pyridoxal phosphate homeostasis protein n=1 Tax=Buchnera aphidicola subsp. Rhopalosiphum maidis TaxID=118109 RepID=A0A3G2I552_BUCRM|nr:YggS family pyridoxal phosphate-dependent enzyme [Buchnera aphidicola]AYN24542.1 YggS family pyridoxal phosphate-dependent enzyme [Buchnera aphidicola (Rhopalosiphum maidis)]